MKHNAVEIEMTILTAIVMDFKKTKKKKKNLPLAVDVTFLVENKMFHKWNMWFHLQHILYIVTNEVQDFLLLFH